MNLCNKSISIGNGLTFHSTKDVTLISKFTGLHDGNNKSQYSLFELYSDSGVINAHKLSINSKYSDYHPVFAPNGAFILFNSTRPKPGSMSANGKTDIYLSNYTDEGLQKPKYLHNINSDYHDSYPSLTKKNKLYFNSDRPGSQGMMDIYVSQYIDGRWLKPKAVDILNTIHSENDLYVDPDERFIILNRYYSDTNEIDLFISHWINNKWTKPESMRDINKQGVWELTPTLSLDKSILYIEVNGLIQCHNFNRYLLVD